MLIVGVMKKWNRIIRRAIVGRRGALGVDVFVGGVLGGLCRGFLRWGIAFCVEGCER